MIRVDRQKIPRPASLSTPFRAGPNKGLTEREVVLRDFASHLAAGGSPHEFSFEYRSYRSPDVRQALDLLFRGKCAYCESRYASTQPMDVEHWRPKAAVHEFDQNGKKTILGGYPWLASDWENLLPSCIDCNRTREQFDAVTNRVEVRGKGNQFPVSGPRMPLPSATGSVQPFDRALILNPTVDEPSRHLTFNDDGTVTARAKSPAGAESIRVYALNRSALAFERLGIARLIEQRLTTIEALAEVVNDTDLSEPLQLDLKDLIAHEVNALYELTQPDRPYSEMARQIIEQYAPHNPGTTHSATAAWPSHVTTLLDKFRGHEGRTDHAGVATYLLQLGFEPHAPRGRKPEKVSTASYIRWSCRGRVRLARLYQNSKGLISDSAPQLAFATSLPGAEPTGNHPKVTFYYKSSSVETVLTAATRLRGWADRQDGP